MVCGSYAILLSSQNNSTEGQPMKLMHLSDLHIGKRVGGFSMTEDQRYILDQILEIAESEQPDAILIAGDRCV